MRLTLILASSLLLACQSYPPPFPREGATKLIENERVVVWDVTWHKGRTTPVHRHTRDIVGVYLGSGTRNIIAQDGTKTPSVSKAGEAVYSTKGVIHSEEGTSDVPLRAILIELVGDSPSGGSASSTLPPAFPRDGAAKLLDNARAVVWDYRWAPQATVPMHRHTMDAVVIWFEAGTLRSTPATGAPSEVVADVGQVRYAPRGTEHSETATSGTPRAIVVELK